MKRKIGIIIIFLLILICINTVNADDISLNDTNFTDINSTYDDINLSEDTVHNHSQLSELLSDSPVKAATWTASGGTFAQFKSIVDSASAGDTIIVTGDYTYNSGFTTDGIYFNKNLTIEGNGHTFNGLNTGRVFNVGAHGVTFNNLIISNGRNWRAGGIYVGATTYINHCVIRDCVATDYGGGLYARSASAIMTYTDFVCNNATGRGGGAICSDGAYYYLDFCNFYNNSARSYGTAFWNDGSGTFYVTNCIFDDKDSIACEVYSNGNNNWNNNWWGSNVPKWGVLLAGGGMGTPESWVVMNFTNTTPFSSSGGSTNLLVELSYAYNRTSNNYQKLNGSLAKRNVTFTMSTGSVSPIKTEFVDNYTTSYSYGAVSSLEINATIDNQTLTLNNPFYTGSFTDLQNLIDATPVGGTLVLDKNYAYVPPRDLRFSNGMFLNKSITIIGNGFNISGINETRIFQVNSSDILLKGINFKEGYTSVTLGDGYYRGGAIFNWGNLTIDGCNFTDNNAYHYGGAIENWRGNLTIKDSNFINNYGSSYGAICSETSAFINITGSVFTRNRASSYSVLHLGQGTVNYNVIFNNTGSYSIYNYDNLEYNWYGTNSPNIGSIVQGSYPTTYVIMNFTNIQPITLSGGTITLLTSLDTFYNSSSGNYSKLNGVLPKRIVTYNYTVGTITPNVADIQINHTPMFTYSSGLSSIILNATIDNQMLYIATSDIGINITVDDDSPQLADTITFTITVHNYGDNMAKDLKVQLDRLPNLVYVSDSSGGSYNNLTDEWYIGNLNVGATNTITVTFHVPYNGSIAGKQYNVTVNASGNYLDFNSTNDISLVNITIRNRTSGSYTFLQYIIDSANPGDTIDLTFNVTYDPLRDSSLIGGMNLNKNITIKGNGNYINGIKTARIFNFQSGYTILDNISFINGITSGSGGAIIASANNANTLIINNSIFINNSASSYGGALYKNHNSVNIIVYNTAFYDNYAGSWGGAHCTDDNGGLNIFDKCIFINNTCGGVGGAVSFCAHGGAYNAIVNNSIFVNNYAPTGSDIYSDNNAFTNTFDNNWWGINYPNWNTATNGRIPQTWFIMNFTHVPTISYSSGVATLTVTIDNLYNNTSGTFTNAPNRINPRNLTFTYNYGTVSPNETIIQNTATATFTYPALMGAWFVNATIDNQILSIGSSDLGINIIPNYNPINDGENISYTITVTNIGFINATGVNVSLNLPLYGLINITTNTSNGTYNETTSIWEIGNLGVGETVTLMLNGTLADPGPYLIWNATIWNVTNYYDDNFTNNTFVSNVTVNQIADLEITKNITNPHPKTKDNVTYILTIYNHGPSTAINVTVFDNLSTNLIYLTFNATKGYYNATNGIWFMDNITPYTNETLNITVLVNNSGITDNFANVTSNITDNNLTNNFANYTFETPPLSDLWVTITMEPQTSNFITFHIQAGNNGIEPANGTIVEFNISNLTIYVNHTTDGGVYGCSTGVWDIGYIGVNETVNMTLIVQLNFPAGLNVTNLTTSVNITSWSTDLYPENNTDNVTFEAEIFGNFRLLQRLIDEALPNTVFVLPRSFAYDPINDAFIDGVDTYDLINGVSIYKNLTIVNPDGYTIGGFGMARCLNITAPNTILDGLKIADGYSPLGAGLNIPASNVQVLRSNFTNNVLWGDYGGAIYVSGNNVLIQDNYFERNNASKLGGAIGARGANNLRILNNTFINNIAKSDDMSGGAIGIINSGATVNTNVFLDNNATSSAHIGSAIFTNNSIVNLEANWFGNNTPDVTTNDLIYGDKPETWIILDWEFVNPNMTGVELNVVFVLYNSTTGEKTPINYGLPYRKLNVTSRDPTLSWYNTTYTGNNSVNYTYNTAIPTYLINATVDYETITLEFSTLMNVYKTLLNDTVWYGDDLIYNITIINYGPHNSLIINVTDLLPSGLTVNTITHTAGSTSQIGDIIYWALNVPAGTTTALLINTTPTVEGNYTNNITLNTSTPLDYFINGTNKTVTGQVLHLSDLEVNLTITSPHFYVGENIVYNVRVANYGPSLAENIIVNLPVGSGFTYLYQDWPGTYSQSTGIWNISSLNTGDILDINITFRINSPGWYNQTINVTSDSVDTNPTNDNKTVSFNVTNQVDLVLKMTINKGEALYGDNSIYITLNVTNKGPSPANNVTVFLYYTGLDYWYHAYGYGSFINDTPTAGRWLVGTLNANTSTYITLRFVANTLGNFTINGRANNTHNDSNWLDNYANVTINVVKYADLTITKTPSVTTAFVGQIINYTITVKNNGIFDTENVTVYDFLPNVLLYNGNNPNYNGTHWFVGNLSVGESKNITFNVTVNGTGYIYNNATVNSSLNDSNINNNHVETWIWGEYKYSDLSITKTTNKTNPFLGENVTFTITVRNNGGYDAENVTVYDFLPIVLLYDGNNPSFNGTEWFVGNLSVGESKNITYIVTVDGVGIIWNNATVNSSYRDYNPGNNHAEVYLDVPIADDLRIYISVVPNPPQANGNFIINISVWNRGFTDNNDVKVEFHLPSILSYVNSTQMGAYNWITGFWDIGFLANGAWANLEIVVYPLTIDNITLECNVSGSVTDVNPTNNRANITFEIVPAFDLVISKTALNSSITDGDEVYFDINVWNNGPNLARNVEIIDYLPYGTKYLFDNSSGVYNNISRIVNWTIPVLYVGDNITIRLILRSWGPGLTLTNKVTVDAYGTDSNITDNTATATVNVTQKSDLEILLNASKVKDVDLGESILFYVTVINHGPSNATGVTVNFTLPNNFIYNGDNSGGSYNTFSNLWTIGNLGADSNITLIINATLNTIGMIKLNATVNGTYMDNDTSNNMAFLNITATPLFDLNITAHWNLTNNTVPWNDLIEYTVIVSNKGPDNATNVTVELIVPGVDYVSHTGPGLLNTTTLIWNVGNLTVGETKNITIIFNATTVGFFISKGNITAYGNDNNTNDNNYTLNLTIMPVVDLVMTNITVNTTVTCVDSILEFNVTVFNRGPCNATNTTIVPFLPTGWTIHGGMLTGNVPVNKTEVFTILVNATTLGNFTVGFNATIFGVDTYPLDNNLTFATIEVIYACDLMITIKSSTLSATTGDIVVYVITVTNLDWRTAHNVTANVTIPPGLSFDHMYLASGNYNPLNGTWTIGNMSYRNSTSLFLFTRATSPGPVEFWVNVTGDDYDFHTWNNNNTVNVTIGPGLDLNITITVDNSTPFTGDNITFTVMVENIGLVNADNVNVDINIPIGFINPRSTDLNFTMGSYYIGNLNSGQVKVFNFTVTVLTKENSTFNVGVGASKWDYNMSNNVANVTVSPIGASDLIVTITSNNSHINIGENVTYTITILNNGTVDVDNIIVFNNLPFSITYATSTPLYLPSSGMWLITNLSAGASETLNITINHTSSGIFNYTVNITGDIIDTNPTNNLDNITITVDEYTDLITYFTVNNNTIIDEGLLNFTITVYNNGSFKLSNVKVYTNLPDTGIYNASGIFDTVNGIWNIGNLTSFENRTITLTVNMTSPGNYTYWANSTCKENERNYNNNNQSLNITIYADYDLKVDITLLSNNTLNVGDNASFLITVSNNGPSTARNVQIIDNILGTPLFISKGTYTPGTWNIGNLTKGETATLNLTLTLTNNGTYTFNITGIADEINHDRNITNNYDNTNITAINGVDLIITITSNASTINNGETVQYTITVTNNASNTAHNVLVETEGLFNGTILSTTYSAGFITGTSWFTPTLNPYQNITLNITKKITKNEQINVNVSSTDVELDNTTNNDSISIIVNKLADLEVIITTNTTNAYIYGNLTFHIIVINHGYDTAENVTVYLNLPYSTNFTDTYIYDSLQGVWYIGSLENNTNTTLNVTVTLNNIGNITFNARVNSTTPDNYTNNNYDNITLNVSSLVDLNINITINNTNTVYAGDMVNFLITVSNSGPSTAHDVNVTYTLPGSIFIPYKGSILYPGFWNVGNLTPGETTYLNITYLLTSTDSGIYNVNVTSLEYDKNILNNNASLNLSLNQSADLCININSNTTILDIGESVFYTIIVTNYGPNSVNNPNIEINLPDDFNINLNMSTNGIFNRTHWIISTLGTGGSGVAYLYIYGTYNLSGNKTINALINSTLYDKNFTNNNANNTVLVKPSVDLSVNFTSLGFFNPDGSITVNITVWNNGPVNATNVTLYTNLPNTNVYNYTKGYFDTLQNIWYVYDLNVGESETLVLNITLENETYFFANITNNIPDWNNSNNVAYLNITTPRIADVSINITVNNTHPGLGESITFTITVTNHGPYMASDVMVMVDLPATPIYVLDKGIFDTVLGNWSIGNLSKNETVTLNITINATNTTTYHTNVTTSINDTNLTNNNATISFNLSATSDLSINLNINQTSFIIGDNITITINLTNNGPDTSENITININLPSGFILDAIFNTTINITSLTAGSNLEFNLTGILTTNGTQTFITNLTSDTYDNDTNNNYDTLTIYVSNIVDLDVKITSNTSNILAGEYIELIINVTNYGPGIAENITINSNIYNATSLKDTGYYDKDTGNWYIGTLNATETRILNLTIQIFENTTYYANITTISTDNDTNNNYDNLTINVTPLTDLNITVTVNNKQPQSNDEITYIIKITNNGPNPAENATMTCNLTIFNFTSANSTNYNETTGIWNIGNINKNETIILKLTYKANNTGNITNTFTVNTTTLENNLNDNTANITIEILNTTNPQLNMVDLIINITVNNSLPKINETIEFNITVYNNASTNASNLTILSILPTGLIPISGFLGTWNITNLSAYTNVSISFTVNVTNYGSFVLNASVDCNEWDRNSVNNRANQLIIVKQNNGNYTDLQINITKSTNITFGELFTYNITVTNNGTITAYDVNCTIGLFDGLKVFNSSSTDYNETFAIWNVGNLTPGASKTLTLTINTTEYGTYTNIFIVWSNDMDANPQNNLAIDTINLNNSNIDVNIKITANTTYGNKNDTILFIVTVTNPSNMDATNTNVTIEIPTGLEIVNFTGYNNGSYYIGDLNSSQTVTFNFTAKINSTNPLTVTVNVTINETELNTIDNYDNITITPVGTGYNGVADLTVNITTSLLNLTSGNMEVNQYPEYGDVPYFTVWVTNHGPDNATNVKVPLTVPNGCSIMAQDAYWDNSTESFIVSNLGVNQTIKLEVSMLIETTDVLLINTTATSDQFDPNITDNTATISMYPFIPEPKCDLNVTVKVIGIEFHANSTVTFNITIRNDGQDIAYNVTVRNTIPTGLVFHNITTYDAYTLNGDGWDIAQILPGASMQFLVTYNITKKGLYQTTVNANSSIQDTDPTSNGAGVAFYAGEAEPPRREVKTKVATPSVTLSAGKVKLNGGDWTFSGKLQLANNTASPSSYSNFAGQTLYANVTGPDAITRTYVADTVTGADGKATFTVPNADILSGENKYTILIWYKGEKTDGEYYLPSSNSKTNIKVVA